MGVNEDEQGACGAHPQCDEPLLAKRVGVFAGQRKLIGQDGGRFRKTHAMRFDIGGGFGRIPLDSHVRHCMDDCRPSQAEFRRGLDAAIVASTATNVALKATAWRPARSSRERRLQDGLAQALRAGEVGGNLRLGDADQRQAAVGFGDDAVLFGEGREGYR